MTGPILHLDCSQRTNLHGGSEWGHTIIDTYKEFMGKSDQKITYGTRINWCAEWALDKSPNDNNFDLKQLLDWRTWQFAKTLVNGPFFFLNCEIPFIQMKNDPFWVPKNIDIVAQNFRDFAVSIWPTQLVLYDICMGGHPDHERLSLPVMVKLKYQKAIYLVPLPYSTDSGWTPDQVIARNKSYGQVFAGYYFSWFKQSDLPIRTDIWFGSIIGPDGNIRGLSSHEG